MYPIYFVKNTIRLEAIKCPSLDVLLTARRVARPESRRRTSETGGITRELKGGLHERENAASTRP